MKKISELAVIVVVVSTVSIGAAASIFIPVTNDIRASQENIRASLQKLSSSFDAKLEKLDAKLEKPKHFF